MQGVLTPTAAPNGVYASFPAPSILSIISSLGGKSGVNQVGFEVEHRFSGSLVDAKEVDCILVWDEEAQVRCCCRGDLYSTKRS